MGMIVAGKPDVLARVEEYLGPASVRAFAMPAGSTIFGFVLPRMLGEGFHRDLAEIWVKHGRTVGRM